MAERCFVQSGMIDLSNQRRLGVPLSQLAVSKTARETHQAVEDWRYWVAMGYEF